MTARHTAIRLPLPAEAFLRAAYPVSLTTVRPYRTRHAAPVRFTWDRQAGRARVMTVAVARRCATCSPGRDLARRCQAVRTRWAGREGPATGSGDPDRMP
jgi:hypothetical protein